MKIDKEYLEKSIEDYLKKYFLDGQSLYILVNNNSIMLKLRKVNIWWYFSNTKMLIENNETLHTDIRTFWGWRKFKKNWDRDRCTVGPYSKELISLNIAKLEFKKQYWPFFTDMFSLIEDLDFNNQAPISLAPLYDDNSQSINYMNQEWYNKLLNDYTEYFQSDNKSDIADKHYQEQARLHGLKFVVR